MRKSSSIISVILLALSGCAVHPTPQNADEYRKVVRDGAYGTHIESYIVNSPYLTVSNRIAKNAKKCLDKTFTKRVCTSTRSSTNCHDTSISFIPTVRKATGKMELHMQRKSNPDATIYVGGEPPASGMYTSIIDIEPAEKNKTKITVYAPVNFYRETPDAVRQWAEATNMGCPEFVRGSSW